MGENRGIARIAAFAKGADQRTELSIECGLSDVAAQIVGISAVMSHTACTGVFSVDIRPAHGVKLHGAGSTTRVRDQSHVHGEGLCRRVQPSHICGH